MENSYKYLNKKTKANDSIVVAVSGGPDSMSLLHLMLMLKKAKIINIICAHVNHNVREESEQEKQFIENYCQENNIIFEYMKIEEYSNDNFQNEARIIRYNFFESVVNKYKAKYLITAHHGDDLIETILMRIVRGSTLKGYAGIPKETKQKNYIILRPLINVTKDKIVEYLRENNVDYVTDSSNQKDVYTRNRYRKYIVPKLKEEDSNINLKFLKFSETLLMCDEYINKQVENKIKNLYKNNTIELDKFKKEEEIIQRGIITNILKKTYQENINLINSNHTDAIYDLAICKKPNQEINLPNSVLVVKTYNKIKFTVENKIGDYKLEVTNITLLPNGKRIERISNVPNNSNYICLLNSQELKLPLYVRNRLDGDKIQIKGMTGTKKIKDVFINEKISMAARNEWPVVVDADNTVVWLPGLKKTIYNKQKEEKYDIILKYN